MRRRHKIALVVGVLLVALGTLGPTCVEALGQVRTANLEAKAQEQARICVLQERVCAGHGGYVYEARGQERSDRCVWVCADGYTVPTPVAR